MRMNVPDDIKKLADIIQPYMIMDEGKKMLVLKEGAPQDVKAAYKSYQDWWRSHRRQ